MPIGLHELFAGSVPLVLFACLGITFVLGKAQWGSIEIGAGGGIFEALQNAGLIIVSLGVVQEAANSSVPALGYAGTYAISSILLTLAGTAMVMI